MNEAMLSSRDDTEKKKRKKNPSCSQTFPVYPTPQSLSNLRTGDIKQT